MIAPPERVWVLDSSSLINSKTSISVADQWGAFKLLETMVEQGRVAMPRQVIRELSEIAHPDLPGAWAPGVRGLQQHPLDAGFDHVQRVMADAPDVVDASKAEEDADPYVVALALQLQAAGYDVIVVTDDIVDRLPIRIAVSTACERVALPHCSGRDFFEACGIKLKKAPAADGDDE